MKLGPCFWSARNKKEGNQTGSVVSEGGYPTNIIAQQV